MAGLQRRALASIVCGAFMALSASGCIGPTGPTCAGGAAQDTFGVEAGAAPDAPDLFEARLQSLPELNVSTSSVQRRSDTTWNLDAKMTFAVPWTPGGANVITLSVSYMNSTSFTGGFLYLGLTGPSQQGSGAELDVPGVQQRIDGAEAQIFAAFNETVAPVVVHSHTGGSHVYENCH